MDVQFLLRISCFLLIGVTLGEAYFIVRDGKSQCSLAPTNNGGGGGGGEQSNCLDMDRIQ